MSGGVYDSRVSEEHYDIIKSKVSQLLNIFLLFATLFYIHESLATFISKSV